MSTPTRHDWPPIDEAMRRALGYTDAVGLSDGTDRPATAAADVAADPSDDIRDELVGVGFEPAGDYANLFTMSGHRRPSASTIDYYAGNGWDAARHNGDTLTFARWDTSDNYAKVMTTTVSGVIISEATFNLDRHGVRSFLTVAGLLP